MKRATIASILALTVFTPPSAFAQVDPQASAKLSKLATDDPNLFVKLVFGTAGDPPATSVSATPMPGSAAQLASWIQSGQIQHFDVEAVTLSQPALTPTNIIYNQPQLIKAPMILQEQVGLNCSTMPATMTMTIDQTTTDSNTFSVSTTDGVSLNIQVGFVPPNITGGPTASMNVGLSTSETQGTTTSTSTATHWLQSVQVPVPAGKKLVAQFVVVQASYENVPYKVNLVANPDQPFSFLYYMRESLASGREWAGPMVNRTHLGNYFTPEQLATFQITGSFSGLMGVTGQFMTSQAVDVNPATDCISAPGTTMAAGGPHLRVLPTAAQQLRGRPMITAPVQVVSVPARR